MRIRVGDDIYPLLRFDENGFALDRTKAPHLRGLVDIYDGAKHLYQCLIIATAENGDEMFYEFKRSTVVSKEAPVDFHRDENAPVAFVTDQRNS